MAKVKFENQKFYCVTDLKLSGALPPAEFHGCTFEACSLGFGGGPENRRTVSSCELVRCKAIRNTSVGGLILVDTLLEDLGTSGLVIAYGTAFKHVTFRGKCGSFLLNFDIGDYEEAYTRANAEYYESVDWALDISEAEFAEFDVRSVPADLIRRDPETQVVVRYDRVAETRKIWERLSLGGTPWQMAMQMGIRWGLKDEVFVAPKRSKNFKKWLAGLQLLRKEGIAEPD